MGGRQPSGDIVRNQRVGLGRSGDRVAATVPANFLGKLVIEVPGETPDLRG